MKKSFLLFVDTETSGVPQQLSSAEVDVDRWPFVVQVAWRVYRASGELVKAANYFIFEEDIFIERSAEKVHGISEELLREKGEERRDVMRLLYRDLRHYHPLVVGHFVEFDSKMLQVAFYQSGLKNIWPDYPHFCTMKATTDYKRFHNHTYPKLAELYEGLFQQKLEDVHDAAIDAEATARCFFELRRKGEIDEGKTLRSAMVKIKRKREKKTGCGLPVVIFAASLLFYLVYG